MAANDLVSVAVIVEEAIFRRNLKKQAYASDLKSRALSVLLYLIDRSDKELTCFPAIQTMAEQLHIYVSTVKRALHELLDSGYIKKDARFRKNKGQTSNLYTLVLFEGDITPNGYDGFGSKDGATEGGLAEVNQENEDEAGQEAYQVEHISFETLKGQKGEVEKPQKTHGGFPIEAIIVEGDIKIKRKIERNNSDTWILVIKQFFTAWNGDRRFHIIQCHEEKIMRMEFFGRFCRLLLYLWTGEGVSLMPP